MTMIIVSAVLKYVEAALTQIWEDAAGSAHYEDDLAGLTCAGLRALGVGQKDLRQFAPKIKDHTITRLRAKKMLSESMFDLEGTRIHIPVTSNKSNQKQTYLRTVKKLHQQAENQLFEISRTAGVKLEWAVASVMEYGNPIQTVIRQLERLATLRKEYIVHEPTGFFIYSMKDGVDIRLQNDPEQFVPPVQLHPVLFVQPGMELHRKHDAVRAFLPERITVASLNVSSDGEVLGARDAHDLDYSLDDLRRNYGLLEVQQVQMPAMPEPVMLEEKMPELGEDILQQAREEFQRTGNISFKLKALFSLQGITNWKAHLGVLPAPASVDAPPAPDFSVRIPGRPHPATLQAG